MSRGLCSPLEALRTSMASLSSSFGSSDTRHADIDRVLGEVNQLGRNIQDLLDYAFLPEPRELSCTVNEIVYSARFHVPHSLWDSLWIARDAQLPGLMVDGPVLSRSLARLIEAAAPLAAQGVLLNVHPEPFGLAFTITFRGAADLLGDPMGLCHEIAARDLGVIGCPLFETTSKRGDTIITVRVPAEKLQPLSEELAA